MTALWNHQQLSEALNLDVKFKFEANRVSIDSRKVQKGDLFIAIKGDNFDGNDFIDEAFEKGAVAAISDNEEAEYKSKKKIIFVKNSLRTLEKLAKKRRRASTAKIVAVTGSVGKTTVKELIYESIKDIRKAYRSAGNYNNHIGMPLSLANMPVDTEIGIFELGMNQAGEISDLCQIAHPHISVVSWVSESHIEFFDSVEDIARAKAEIFEWLVPDGKVVIPADSDHQELMEEIAEDNGVANIISFGNIVNNLNINEKLQLVSGYFIDERVDFPVFLAERFVTNNIIATLTVLKLLNIDLTTSLMKLELFEGIDGRGKVIELENGVTLIDDSYNASPESMKKALRNLSSFESKGKKIAVIGEMLELGDRSEEYHLELEEYLKDIDYIYLKGKGAEPLSKKLAGTKKSNFFHNIEDLEKQLKNSLESGDVALIKGSHGSEVWKVADKLTA